jgi:hypothetical protein
VSLLAAARPAGLWMRIGPVALASALASSPPTLPDPLLCVR